MYKIAITGGNTFNNVIVVNNILDEITQYIPVEELLFLVPGNVMKIENIAMKWAEIHNTAFDNLIQSLTMTLNADYKHKNSLLIEAKDPDLLVVFPIENDGMEANDLIQRCLQHGITVQEVIYEISNDKFELREIEEPKKLLDNINVVVSQESKPTPPSSNGGSIVKTNEEIQILTSMIDTVTQTISPNVSNAEDLTRQVLALFNAQAQAYKRDYPDKTVVIPTI